MNIEIKGAYGETNFGDDLLMCVFENFFIKEFPQNPLNFIGEKASYVSNFLKKGSYMSPDFNPDFLVYGGGTQFFSFRTPEKITLKDKLINVLKNPNLIIQKYNKTNKIAPELPSTFLGFGIGPFNGTDQIKVIASEKVAKAKFVGVRDDVSFNYCKEWDVPAVLGADVVFSSYFNLPKFKKINNSKKKIGIIVRDWKWESTGADYIDKIKSFYNNMNSSETELQFIVFAPSKDKKWMKDLENENKLVWDPDKYSIDSFLEILNSFDVFISARYHGAIIASLLGKPVICVEIEPKLRILTEQVSEFKLWEKPFSLERLENYILELDMTIDYSKSNNSLREKSDYMLSKFKTFLQGYENTNKI